MNPQSERQVVLLHSDELEAYHYPPECPFNSQRAGKAVHILSSMGLLTGPGRSVRAPTPADRATLEKIHTPAYLDALQHAEAGHLPPEAFRMGLGTGDNPVFVGMYDYAALAAGATLLGAELIASGEAAVAFNPSGGYHHARPGRAAGFCYINDVALACHALTEHGKRVFYLDVDVHHGDGVQAAFYRRSDVMTLSLHESGQTLYPGTGFEDEIGEGEGAGYAANVPLPMGTYDEAYLRAFEAVALPLLDAYDPDAIVLEIGMDALAGDPLAHLSLTNNAHAEVLAWLLQRGKPILATGGGGYHVENTARGWALAWNVFCGEDDHHVGAMGGVMLESTEWHGGLRDRQLAPSALQRATVEAAIDATVEAVRRNVFGLHGI